MKGVVDRSWQASFMTSLQAATCVSNPSPLYYLLSMVEALSHDFSFAVQLRCFLHFKKNVEKTLEELGIPAQVIQEFLSDIFGERTANTKRAWLTATQSRSLMSKLKIRFLKDRSNLMRMNCMGWRIHGDDIVYYLQLSCFSASSKSILNHFYCYIRHLHMYYSGVARIFGRGVLKSKQAA